MSKKFLAFLVFQLAFQFLFYKSFTGPAFFFFTFSVNIVLFLTKKQGHHPLAYLLSAFSTLLSLHESLNPHPVMTPVNYISLLFLLLYSWSLYRDETGNLFFHPLCLSLEKLNLKPGLNKLPILPILLGLFSTFTITSILHSADSIFAKNIQFIVDFLNQELIQRLNSSLWISLPFALVTYIYFKKTKISPHIQNLQSQLWSIFNSSSNWASIFLNLSLGYFLYSSISFLKTQVNPNIPGFTYSAYVSQGFNELIFVSVLTLVISQFSKNLFGKTLSILTLGLIGLNTYKLYLYTQENGLTQTRILGGWFLLGLTIVLATQLLNKKILTRVSIATFLCILGLANLIDTDTRLLLAYPPTVNKLVDRYYLINHLKTKLSPTWPDIVSQNNNIVASLANIKPENISYDQYYQTYWAVSENSQIQQQIKDLINTYGTIDKVAFILEDDLKKWSQNDEYSQNQKKTIQDLRQKGLFPSYPLRSWQYTIPKEKNIYSPEFVNLYKNISINSETWFTFEQKIPDSIRWNYSSKVWDRKNY